MRAEKLTLDAEFEEKVGTTRQRAVSPDRLLNE